MDRTILELKEMVFDLVKSHAIWYQLVHPEERKKYLNTITSYGDFFNSTIDSHLRSIMVLVYQLFDTRKGTKSIPNLFKKLEAENRGDTAKKASRYIESWMPTIKKVKSIRCQVYAHRAASASPESVFEMAELKVDSLGNLVGVVQFAVAMVCTNDKEDDTAKLLNDLRLSAHFARKDLERLLGTLSKIAAGP